MDVAGDQSTQIVGVLTRTAAATLMQQEANPVHVLEDAGTPGTSGRLSRNVSSDLFPPPFFIKARQLFDLLTVDLWGGKPEFFFEGLFQDRDIAVLAKDQRHNNPIVSGADLAIASPVSEEMSSPPPRNVRRLPRPLGRIHAKWRGVVTSISGGQKLAAAYGFDHFSHNYAVHFHARARGKILYREFVFGRNIGFQRVGLRLQQNLIAFAEIGEGN